MSIYIKLAMACHKQAILEAFNVINESINRTKSKLEEAKKFNHIENIQLLNEKIDRLNQKWKHEEDEQIMMDLISEQEYGKKFPEKIERIKNMFGDFIINL